MQSMSSDPSGIMLEPVTERPLENPQIYENYEPYFLITHFDQRRT